MAKAKQAPNVNHFADPYEWAAETLCLRFEEVISFCGAALVPWNINGVHDMRVALRRLRSTVRDFVGVIDEKPLKRVNRDLKKIADSLGTVRDLDVAIIALEELADETDEESIKLGIGEMIEDLRTRREKVHSRLLKVVTVGSLDDLRERFTGRIDDALRQHELFRPSSMKETGRDVIEARLRDFCEIGTSIYMPFDSLRLHDLRIATKRLRYAIELFADCWDNEIIQFAKELAKIQSRLGMVHDCDLWIENLTRRLTEKGPGKNQIATRSTAASWLLARFVQDRSKAYGLALDLWREWEANGFVARLSEMLQT